MTYTQNKPVDTKAPVAKVGETAVKATTPVVAASKDEAKVKSEAK